MYSRRLVKRSILGSRVCAPSPTGDGALLPGVVQAVKLENRETVQGSRRNVYTVLLQDGTLKEYSEEEIVTSPAQMTGKAQLKFKTACTDCEMVTTSQQQEQRKSDINQKNKQKLLGKEEAIKRLDSKKANRIQDHEKDHTCSVSLLEQKHKVVSSSIDVPHARKLSEEVAMDKVTAAMVLTSLSTSPLVHSPPVKVNDGTNESWKEGGFNPSSYSSSGYWSWSAPSDQSNPSTPSPPLSTDSCKPFHIPSQPDDDIDEVDASNLLFDEPIPRKRKNSLKVMFKCLWKNCGKVLSTATGIQKHICTVHLGRSCDSDCSDGEEDFYYTEIKLNTDSVTDGLSSLSPVSPSMDSAPHIFSSTEPGRPESVCMKNESKLSTPLSRSAPSTLYLVHADHAYQVKGLLQVLPGSEAEWCPQTDTLAQTGHPASPPHIRTHGFGEHHPQAHVVLSSPPRAAVGLRKSRGEGKKCRKVYGMENRDMWCTACRWKKACQRFID
ncbi:zinc finger protein 704-like [Acipenser oxyrinchus oxyrinchus]|uniref:Zinc finger protein 704-like n=1 Tax=Acipenser oxyrinchus oxyrinchus TaxID=40147 RepID=A0AAD8GFG9_ACIOX|nr:zinc finger protein 704-like [Acipenser oxyrinchus oxyrinchus]